MKYPLINKRPRQAVVVPNLAGGINLRDSLSAVLDNQLTDSLNVWFKDGVLKTRPGVGDLAKHSNTNSENYYTNTMQYATTKTHDIYKTYKSPDDSQKEEIVRLVSCYDDHELAIYSFWVGENTFIELPLLNISGFDTAAEDYFFVKKDNILYCFLDGGEICKIADDKNEWETVENKDLYAPKVLINGKASIWNEEACEGDLYESYNLLCDRYRATYSAYNTDNTFTDGNGKYYHFMQYCLPILPKPNTRIKITYSSKTGNVEKYEISVPANVKEEAIAYDLNSTQENKNQVILSGTKIRFRTYATSAYSLRVVEKAEYKKDDLEIEATVDLSESRNKVFKSRFTTWFGGGTKGLNSGSRLFLGGNTEEPNLVLWSDLNNPLYFPENNYFYVGDSSSAVTAFGKQSDMLVIFKENETYYTQYEQNNNITANDLINQNIIDYIAESVYFPLVQINSGIGCDCPDTVQLCRNRLVWTNSNGKVYTLVSNNQYNERNIFEIGELIHRKLRQDINLKNAYSCDWNGYYMILSNGNAHTDVYVMDYNSYGYQYVSSYSKNEDANLKIPWYYWQFPAIGSGVSRRIFTVLDNLIYFGTGNSAVLTANISEENKTDDIDALEQPINCMLQTKLFEFSTPGHYKNIDLVSLSLGGNDAAPINVQFITDMGTEEDQIVLENNESAVYSPEHIKSIALYPCIKSVLRFGVKLLCDGQIALDGITINYRILGGAK